MKTSRQVYCQPLCIAPKTRNMIFDWDNKILRELLFHFRKQKKKKKNTKFGLREVNKVNGVFFFMEDFFPRKNIVRILQRFFQKTIRYAESSTTKTEGFEFEVEIIPSLLFLFLNEVRFLLFLCTTLGFKNSLASTWLLIFCWPLEQGL